MSGFSDAGRDDESRRQVETGVEGGKAESLTKGRVEIGAPVDWSLSCGGVSERICLTDSSPDSTGRPNIDDLIVAGSSIDWVPRTENPAEPTTYAEATSTYTVGNYTLTAGDGNGDWTIANGDTSGRKLTLEAQSGNNGTGTGAANNVGFTNGTDTFYGVIDGDGDTVNSGSPVDISAVDVWEIADPV